MIPAAALCLVVGFCIAWAWRDCKWTKAAKKKKFMVVNGELYTVKHEGSEALYALVDK